MDQRVEQKEKPLLSEHRFVDFFEHYFSKDQQQRLLVLLFYHHDPKLFQRLCRALALSEGKPKAVAEAVIRKHHIGFRFLPVVHYMAYRILENKKRHSKKECPFSIEKLKKSLSKELPLELISDMIEKFTAYHPWRQKTFLKYLLHLHIGNKFIEIDKRLESYFLNDLSRKPEKVAKWVQHFYGFPQHMGPFLHKRALKAKARVLNRLRYQLNK